MTNRQIRNRAGRTHEICKRHQCAAIHTTGAIHMFLRDRHFGGDALARHSQQTHPECLRHATIQHHFMCAVRRRLAGTHAVDLRLLRRAGHIVGDSLAGEGALLCVFRSILRHLRSWVRFADQSGR